MLFSKSGYQEMVAGYLWGPFPNQIWIVRIVSNNLFWGIGIATCVPKIQSNSLNITVLFFHGVLVLIEVEITMDLRFLSDQPFQQACPVIPLGLWPSWSKPQETQKVIDVGGLEHGFYFPFHIWDVILPVDELHHFSRWAHWNHQPVIDVWIHLLW